MWHSRRRLPQAGLRPDLRASAARSTRHPVANLRARLTRYPVAMSEVAEHPKPSPEIEQLVLFGRIDEAVALYAKQAEVDEATARAVVEALAES